MTANKDPRKPFIHLRTQLMNHQPGSDHVQVLSDMPRIVQNAFLV